MSSDDLKQLAAEAALKYLLPKLEYDDILGIGTGSTANCFIDLLAAHKGKFAGAVASSEASAQRLRKHGIALFELNNTGTLKFYIDGADEANPALELVKGGGGALTREKVIANASEAFICIADSSKKVEHLGTFPLPVEVIPMARSFVARALFKLGGEPVYREGALTDNGNVILDVHHLHPIAAPKSLEEKINQIPGVVTCGLFALRPANLLILASPQGCETLHLKH